MPSSHVQLTSNLVLHMTTYTATSSFVYIATIYFTYYTPRTPDITPFVFLSIACSLESRQWNIPWSCQRVCDRTCFAR